jgi:TfoX/Sxy family transcriptional regulator of competence genes
MGSDFSFVEYVIEQIDGVGVVTAKKMFGEYCVYVNDLPIIWVCDNTVFVKKLDIVGELLSEIKVGYPYPGAKEFYILDVDNADEMKSIALALVKVTPMPKKKAKKKSQS